MPQPGGNTTIYQYDSIGNTFTPKATVPGGVVDMTYDTVGNILYVSAIPEPASLTLLGLAAVALLKRGRRA